MNPSVSFTEDDWIMERQYQGETIFWVELSDGRRVYQDDGRYEGPAWLRLKEFLKNGLTINTLGLKFRTALYTLSSPAEPEGFYFAKGAQSVMGSGTTTSFVSLGYVKDGKLFVRKISVPEFIEFPPEERPCVESPFLILHGKPES